MDIESKVSTAVTKLPISAFKKFQFPILEKGSRIVNNAESGGMAIDTRFVFTRL